MGSTGRARGRCGVGRRTAAELHASLVLASLVILTGFLAPIWASVFSSISVNRFIYSSPYLALAFVALLA